RVTIGADDGKTVARAMEGPGIPPALDGVERTIGQRSRDHPWRSDRRLCKFVVDDE
ncbi:MAG: hypothetical protein IIB57_13755, partial [Planctomycetes bacterium]|nr:hypothetical protein [Planctomycetota bacterium]